jgi:hypothetical protein
MKLIPLTKGKYAKVSDEDFAYLSQWTWYCDTSGYAARRLHGGGKSPVWRIHNFLLSSDGLIVDHIDRDPLNNQRENLRLCTHSQNLMNRGIGAGNTSGFKGVTWCKRTKSWQAQCKAKGKKSATRRFKDKVTAARFYDQVAKEMHGDFAVLNFKG